jgi:integrase/recombinase XerD
MGNRPKVEIYLRVRLENGKQPYYKSVWESKSRLKPFTCLVAGVPQFFLRGTYHLRYSFNGRQMWESVGNDPRTAVDARKSRLWQLANPNAKINDNLIEKSEAAPVERGTPKHRVDNEIKTYLSNVAKLAPRTLASYRLTLNLFQQSCSKTFVHQITKQDLQAFDSVLLKRGDEDRTRHNRLTHIVTFLRNREGRRGGPPITDVSIRVKFVESPPEPYTRQELEDLFHVSTDDDKQLWRFVLGTGFREAEASVAEYTDINPEKKTIAVVEKAQFGFKPKDCEKRIVPVPDELIAQLKARKNGFSLIFHKNGQPDSHLLRRLKAVAFAGGLNCGKCVGMKDGKEVSCADAPVCKKWILHRFRKNFATDRHENGASVNQIKKWLGHSSLETTLRYLGTADDMSEKVRDICNGAHVGL